MTTFRVMGRSGPLGRGLTRDDADELAAVSGGTVEPDPSPDEDPFARDDWPVHQPAAPDAPIPGRHWYSGCDPDRPRVRPDGRCEDCGREACPDCGAEKYPDGGCRCPRP